MHRKANLIKPKNCNMTDIEAWKVPNANRSNTTNLLENDNCLRSEDITRKRQHVRSRVRMINERRQSHKKRQYP